MRGIRAVSPGAVRVSLSIHRDFLLLLWLRACVGWLARKDDGGSIAQSPKTVKDNGVRLSWSGYVGAQGITSFLEHRMGPQTSILWPVKT